MSGFDIVGERMKKYRKGSAGEGLWFLIILIFIQKYILTVLVIGVEIEVDHSSALPCLLFRVTSEKNLLCYVAQ